MTNDWKAMAREADLTLEDDDVIFRFAALVRAAALEEAAQVCENPPIREWHAPPMFLNCTNQSMPSKFLAHDIRDLKDAK